MLHVEGDQVVNFTPNHNHELEYKNFGLALEIYDTKWETTPVWETDLTGTPALQGDQTYLPTDAKMLQQSEEASSRSCM